MLNWTIAHPWKRGEPICSASVSNIIAFKIYCTKPRFFYDEYTNYYKIEITLKGEAHTIRPYALHTIDMAMNYCEEDTPRLLNLAKQLLTTQISEHQKSIKEINDLLKVK